MKQAVVVGMLCAACYLAGRATTIGAGVSAQEPPAAAAAQAPQPKAVPGQGVYFSIDEIKKRFVTPDKKGSQTNIITDSYYRLAVQRRPYYDPPKETQTSKILSHWDDAEMHERFSQYYFIVDGTGAVLLGGKPQKQNDGANGQHVGGPTLEGAKAYRVKAGDWVAIPPMTWHMTQPDPGQTLVYGLMNINIPK
jgi:mannose-6-phosphate isomerase-like protein (cupin superfamily)